MKHLFLFLVLILSNCSNESLDTWESYEINEGDHYAHRPGYPRVVGGGFMHGRHLKFKTRFTSSTLYQPYYDDINKLYGFTDANSSVHENSVRFGWRHDGEGSIEIFAYWYNNGKRGFHKMGETQIETPDTYEIWAKNDTYYFRFNDIEFTTPRNKNTEHGVRKRLWPYFGGNASAPNEMLIQIYEYRDTSAPICYSCF